MYAFSVLARSRLSMDSSKAMCSLQNSSISSSKDSLIEMHTANPSFALLRRLACLLPISGLLRDSFAQ